MRPNVCPYCGNGSGYYKFRTVKIAEHYDLTGMFQKRVEIETVYQHEKTYCRSCNKQIDSFVRHIQRELDNE